MHEKNKYSIIKPEKSPIFYGYIVLLFGSIGILASIPGQTVGVSVFTDPVKEALGLSRTNFSNAYMIGTLLSALIVAKAGVWFDRFGARYVAFFAVIFLAFGLFLFSFSQTLSRNISELLQLESWIIPFTIIIILFFIIRFCGQGVLTMASRNMIMRLV
ncbi:hypothetical protein [Algibacter mikhailovii]|uniref:MFS transporter n=1 Tax=Algibacter mikhailovii TaxID=425498 RepID=A0A918QTX4_9FLAO|nr:hypothetical protein [Algibacter mikhailovii]GGZ69251.1 hypothetical protein GCM10007028_02790 [Algibacter mikhailovii]